MLTVKLFGGHTWFSPNKVLKPPLAPRSIAVLVFVWPSRSTLYFVRWRLTAMGCIRQTSGTAGSNWHLQKTGTGGEKLRYLLHWQAPLQGRPSRVLFSPQRPHFCEMVLAHSFSPCLVLMTSPSPYPFSPEGHKGVFCSSSWWLGHPLLVSHLPFLTWKVLFSLKPCVLCLWVCFVFLAQPYICSNDINSQFCISSWIDLTYIHQPKVVYETIY